MANTSQGKDVEVGQSKGEASRCFVITDYCSQGSTISKAICDYHHTNNQSPMTPPPLFWQLGSLWPPRQPSASKFNIRVKVATDDSLLKNTERRNAWQTLCKDQHFSMKSTLLAATMPKKSAHILLACGATTRGQPTWGWLAWAQTDTHWHTKMQIKATSCATCPQCSIKFKLSTPSMH